MSNNIEGKVIISGVSNRLGEATAHMQLVADHITRSTKEIRQ